METIILSNSIKFLNPIPPPKPEKLRGKSENQLIIKGAKKSRCETKLSYYGAKKDGGLETTRKFYRAAKSSLFEN